MQPDVGAVPNAVASGASCVGSVPVVEGTLSNDAGATAPATFEVLVDGVVVETVGPLAPGESETVVLSGEPGGALEGLEDQTVTVELRSGGEVLASRVITVDCVPGSPSVAVSAQLACADGTAQGTVTVTNNGPDPVEVTATVNGTPVGTALVVAPATSATRTTALAAFEDRTITVAILVDGQVAGTYTVTPNCVAPRAAPSVSVAGQECPPPTTTVTLANSGDPDSRVVFVIRVNGRVVQRSAPIYGGDTTTIVGDLSRYEDRTVTVTVRANGELLARRTIAVNCDRRRPAPTPGSSHGTGTGTGTGAGAEEVVSAGSGSTGPAVLAAGTLRRTGKIDAPSDRADSDRPCGERTSRQQAQGTCGLQGRGVGRGHSGGALAHACRRDR